MITSRVCCLLWIFETRIAITIMTDQHQHHDCEEDITIFDIIEIIAQLWCVCVCARACVYILVHACVHAWMHACVESCRQFNWIEQVNLNELYISPKFLCVYTGRKHLCRSQTQVSTQVINDSGNRISVVKQSF